VNSFYTQDDPGAKSLLVTFYRRQNGTERVKAKKSSQLLIRVVKLELRTYPPAFQGRVICPHVRSKKSLETPQMEESILIAMFIIQMTNNMYLGNNLLFHHLQNN
jgi:hypothetical protein